MKNLPIAWRKARRGTPSKNNVIVCFFIVSFLPSFIVAQESNTLQKEATSQLSESIQKILNTSLLKKAKIGLFVQNLHTDEILFSKNSDKLFSPASNTKLVSTAAALFHLGPDYRFRTLLASEKGSFSGSQIKGNLYLKGFGDPKLTVEDLWLFADELLARGITEITGDLIIDNSFFDDQEIVPGFETKPSVQSPYRAKISASALNFNAMALRVFPANKAGQNARIFIEPIGEYVLFTGKIKTSTKKTRLTVDCKEKIQSMVCKVGGTIAIDHPGLRIRRRVFHPRAYLGKTFLAILQERNISFQGKILDGVLPENIETIYVHVSEDLGTFVRDINKASNNFMAEMVLKTLGAEYTGTPGSTKNGIDAVARYLESIGIPPTAYRMTNGSGLWGNTQFRPSQIVKILASVNQDSRIAPDFNASLSVAGADGTLRSRMHDSSATRVLRAKTGTLNGVICLSGYVRLGNDHLLGFSFLLNDLEVSSRSVYEIQAELASAMADYLATISPESVLPPLSIHQSSEEDF